MNSTNHKSNLKGEKFDEIREQIAKRKNMSNFYYFFGLFFKTKIISQNNAALES